MVKLAMTRRIPAWQEILLLNYHERLAIASTEVREALNLALEDTARDVAGRSNIWDMELPECTSGRELARQLLGRRKL